MHRFVLLIMSALLLGTGVSFAESGPAATGPEGTDIKAVIMDEAKLAAARQQQLEAAKKFDHSGYDRVVHFYGDSIARGFGYYSYDHPGEFNSIERIAQAYLADQGIGENEIYFRFAWSQSFEQIAEDVAAGIIRPGDVVIFSDGGPHENNVLYRTERIRKTIAALPDAKVQLVFTTMFDFSPELQLFNSYYDKPIENEVSVNRIVFREASSCCAILDWNGQMDSLYDRLDTEFGAYPMHDDGIHPNIIGNLLLARSIIEFLGIPTPNRHAAEKRFVEALKDYCPNWPVQCGDSLTEADYPKIFRIVEEEAAARPILGKAYKLDFHDRWLRVRACIVGTLSSIFGS